jgi:acyl carrier protein
MAMTTTETVSTTTGGPGPIEARIRAILRRVGGLEGPFSAHADIYRELGVKSIAALDLLLSLEEEFGVAITDDAFGQACSVSALVSLVQGAT